MPLYDYRCERDHLTESIQRMDQAVIPCRVCSSPAQRIAANRTSWVWQGEIDSHGNFRRYIHAKARAMGVPPDG